MLGSSELELVLEGERRRSGGPGYNPEKGFAGSSTTPTRRRGRWRRASATRFPRSGEHEVRCPVEKAAQQKPLS